MSFPQNSVISPSVHSTDEQNFNAPGTGRGFHEQPACRQDPDAFPPDDELTPDEEEELHARYLARLEGERAHPGYVDTMCVACHAALLVPVGTYSPRCPSCELPTAAEYRDRLAKDLAEGRERFDRETALKLEAYQLGLEHGRRRSGLRGLIRRLVAR